MQASSPSQQLAALAVVLEHSVITSDPLLLCCAARVCRAWRAAVAGAGAGTTAVVINNHTRHPQHKPQEFANALLSKVSSFAAWLPKHAPAVRSISLSCSPGESQPALNSAGQLLALALQLAAAGRKPLPLPRFESTFATSEVLAALPASLTALSLGGPVPHNLAFSSTGALTAALHRMTGLRALSLDMPDEALGDEVTLKPMGSLTHLTRLLLRLAGLKRVGTWFDLREALTGLPALQDLCCDLRFQQPDDRAMVACMGGPQLSAMTALTRLQLSVAPILPGPGGWLAMPPHVQELSVSLTDPGWQLSEDEQEVSVIKPVPAMQLAGLQHLRRLTLRCCQGHSLAGLPGSGDVLQQLTRLEALELHYSTIQAAAQDAGLWKSLPGLAGLCVSDPRAGDLSTLLAWQRLVLLSLPSIHGLTRLELLLYDSQSAERALSVGTTLSGLTKLEQLTIDMAWRSSRLCHRDCLALTHLRALTSLVLRGVQDAVDDTVAVALACNLTQLRHLDLSGSAMRSDTPMPALASLRHLTQITLPRSEYSYSTGNRDLLQRQRRGAGLPDLIVLQ